MSRKTNRRMMGVHPSYKGGYTIEMAGYVYEFCPSHPRCNAWGYVPQHRLVAEDMLGRPLSAREVIHHKDGNPLNNARGNLDVMAQTDHRKLHAQALAATQKARLTEDAVREALQGRSLRQAAALLQVHTQTLRNRFPELLEPRKRKSPTRIDDPAVWDLIRRVAPDPDLGYRDIAAQYQISFRTVQRICDRLGIPWVKKTKKGEKHTRYRRRTATPAE